MYARRGGRGAGERWNVITLAWLVIASSANFLAGTDWQVADDDAFKYIVPELLDLNSNAFLTRWLLNCWVPLHLGDCFLEFETYAYEVRKITPWRKDGVSPSAISLWRCGNLWGGNNIGVTACRVRLLTKSTSSYLRRLVFTSPPGDRLSLLTFQVIPPGKSLLKTGHGCSFPFTVCF